MRHNIISEYTLSYLILIIIRDGTHLLPEANEFYIGLSMSVIRILFSVLITLSPMIIGYLYFKKSIGTYKFLEKSIDYPSHLYVLFVAIILGIFDLLIHVAAFGESSRRMHEYPSIFLYVFELATGSDETTSILLRYYIYAVALIWIGLTLGIRIAYLTRSRVRHI